MRTILILAACLVTACTFEMRPGTDAEDGEEATVTVAVAGQLFYPERIALPGQAVLHIRVDAVDVDGIRIMSEQRQTLDGRQVPLPLGLTFERSESPDTLHRLRAWVSVPDQAILRDTGPVLLAPESDQIDLGELRLWAFDSALHGPAWQCGRHTLSFVSPGAERAILHLDNQVHELVQTQAASGVRYESVENESLWIHEKGGQMLLAVADEVQQDCQTWSGPEADIVARGNEPGWMLEVGENQLELLYDYGTARLDLPLLARSIEGLSVHYHAAGAAGALLAVFRKQICNDDATGMPYPWAAEIQFAERRFSGCGGDPETLLSANPWHVEMLGEQVLGEDIEVSLHFDGQGRVNGRAACNSWFADYELSGEGLTIGRPGATLMACPEPLMSLERQFFDLLETIRRFDIDAQGRLVLVTADSRILARPERSD